MTANARDTGGGLGEERQVVALPATTAIHVMTANVRVAGGAAWWGGLGEERQVALPATTAIHVMTANVRVGGRAAWWGGLGEERQVALPPRT